MENLKEELEKHIRNFKILTEDEVKLIVDSSIVRYFDKGTILIKEGQIPIECYMIVKGCVREYVLTDGDEKTISFYMEGDTITPYSDASKSKPFKNYLECSEDCILTISNDNFEQELRKKLPRLDAIIQQEAMENLEESKEKITSFISSSPEERYTKLLEEKPSLFNRVPQHQIASYLGIKPESLSRIRKRIHAKKP